MKGRNFENNQFDQIFFIKLLLARIEQVDDIRSYHILTQLFNDDDLSFYLEDLELYLFQLFLYKPHFFVKGEYKYKQGQLNEYINQSLPPAFFTNKESLDLRNGHIYLTRNSLLIEQSIVDDFKIKELKNNIEKNTDR